MATTVQTQTQNRFATWLIALFAFFVAGSFLINLRGFWPCVIDDSYITARYAANFADGAGLTFNVGYPPVEGFSDPLWLAWLALVYRIFGSSSVILGAKLLSLISLFAIAVVFLRTSYEANASRAASWVATGLLLALPSTMLWSLAGLETMLYALLILLIVVFTAREIRLRSALPLATIFVGLATLVRPEAPMFFAAIVLSKACAWWSGDKGENRQFWRSFLADAGTLCVILLLILSFRFHYFHALVPNTFFVKAGGASKIFKGAKYIARFLTDPLTFVLAIGTLYGILRNWRRPIVLASTICIALQLAFVLWSGGDWMPLGRFMVPILPVCLYPFALAFDDAHAALNQTAVPSARRAIALAVVLVLAVSHLIFGIDAIRALNWRFSHGLDTREALGVWMNHNLSKNTWVAYGDVGALPFYSRLEWIDFNGLVTREVAAIKYEHRHSPGSAEAAINQYVISQHPGLIILVANKPEIDAPPDDYGTLIKDDAGFLSQYKPVGVLTAYLPAKVEGFDTGRYLQVYSKDSDNAVLVKEIECLNTSLADGMAVQTMIDHCSNLG